MKLRTFVLAAAGVLGNVAIAGAQPAAPQEPPPAPPPAAQPPAAEAPAAPPADPSASSPSAPAQPSPAAAPPAAPVQQPALSAQAQQGEAPQSRPPQEQPQTPPPVWSPPVSTVSAAPLDADRALEDDSDKEGPQLRWRGTTFTWNQAATTTTTGIGRDNIGGEEEFYGWDFTVRPKFYMVDLPKDKVTLAAEIGFETELTDGSTVQRSETLFKDVLFAAIYTRSLWEGSGKDKGEYSTSVALTGGLRFPTSKRSFNQGKIVATSIGPSVNQKIKLLGQKADGLNNVTIAVGLTWGHLFSDSFTPTNAGLGLPRQNATGQTIYSDQLGGYSFAMNTLTTTVSIGLPIYRGLQLSTGLGLLGGFKHDFEPGGDESDCDVIVPNVPNGGCVEAMRDETRTLYQPATSFDVNLTYPILEVASVAIGYQNLRRAIGEDGQRRNILYSGDAQFYIDLTANLDSIYSKVTKRGVRKPAPQTASR